MDEGKLHAVLTYDAAEWIDALSRDSCSLCSPGDAACSRHSSQRCKSESKCLESRCAGRLQHRDQCSDIKQRER